MQIFQFVLKKCGSRDVEGMILDKSKMLRNLNHIPQSYSADSNKLSICSFSDVPLTLLDSCLRSKMSAYDGNKYYDNIGICILFYFMIRFEKSLYFLDFNISRKPLCRFV